MKWGYIIFALMVLFAFSGKAQYSNKVHFRNISVKDGLSFPVITCILQDKKGFIWVGTEVGLNKYDSQKFKVYYSGSDAEGSLSNDHITCLYEDERQRLWAGTLSGLNVYDRAASAFKKFQDELLGSEKILAVTGDGRGNTWVLAREHLVLLNGFLNVVKTYRLSDIAPNTGITVFSTAKADAEGRLWIYTNKGLRLFDDRLQKLANPLQDSIGKFSSNVEFFSTIYFGRQGRIWVASRGDGLKYYEPSRGKWRQVQNLSSRYINGLAEDVNQKIWIATGRNGLNIYDPETEEVEVIRYADKPESNFVSNSLSCIYADKLGGIWIGTFNNGLQYYFQHQLKFNLYYSEGQISGINSNYITSFAVDENNGIWIGAGEEGLLYYDRASKKFNNIRPDRTDIRNAEDLKENFYILSLLLTEGQDHLLAGTLTGFYDYHISKDKWSYYHYQKEGANSMPAGFVAAMLQDGNIIYLATFSGISVYDLQTRVVHDIRPPMPHFRVIAIAQNDTSVFIGTRYYGLWRLSKNTHELEKITAKDANIALPERIREMYIDKNKRLLVGTDFEGLFRCDPGFSKVEKLESSFQNRKLAFMSICEDPQSGYWIATNRGLARVSEALDIKKILDQKEGFEPTYFLQDALMKAPDDEIIVGGNTGFYSFFPASFYSPSAAVPEIHLTDFLLSNKSVAEPEAAGFEIRGDLDENELVRLPKYQHLLTFEYAALDFHNPSRIDYSYRLEPYEEDWNDVGNRRFATYRDLPAGAYTFKVKYRIANEASGDNMASLQVIIPPKPWLSWWAYLLYAAVLFAVVRQFYLYRRNRRKLRQEIEMQKFQKEKMEELYNFKIDFFTQVTHELRTPLTLIMGPLEEIIRRNNASKDSNLLEIIQRNAQKLLQTVNQILDFRKIENLDMKVYAKKGNIVAFAEEILYSFSRHAGQKGIELQFETNMEEGPFVLFDKDIMEKILVNLAANAVKFTQKGRIRLRVFERKDQPAAFHYFIEISDTGQGIKPENQEKVFESFFQEQRGGAAAGSGLGLKMVKELTSLHHGAIELSSEVGKGTTFLLSFPKADLALMDEEPAKPRITQEIERTVLQDKPPEEVVQSSAKVLIVDDEADVLSFLEEIFEPLYQVYATNSAKKAIEIAKSEMPDIIISDVMMPDMNGYELCAYTKADFLLCHIPVILLTALNTTEHEIEGLKTGADAYVSKPFPVNLLKANVENLLASRQKLKQAFLNSAINDAGELTQNNSDQKFIEEVISLIDKKIDETRLEISDISQEMGMSASTFYRKLKSLTSLSGNELIKTIRLKRSLEYLKNTDMNISEIAYQVGFSDPKYFSTCFRKFYKVTPTDFMAKNRT